MNKKLMLALLVVVSSQVALAQPRGLRNPLRDVPNRPADPDGIYELTADSYHQEGVPEGRVEGPFTHQDRIYPGFSREYWVYIPQQYDPEQPAALTIFLDGHQYLRDDYMVRARHVLDNLIHRKEIPVMIGVFVNPAHSEGTASPTDRSWGTDHRAAEYIATDGVFARFLIEELVPAVAERYHLRDDPRARCITGASQGGAGAFIAAWERPDAFGKVISHVGSFVGGPHIYPEQVEAFDDVKPIRVSFQEGAYDNANLIDLTGDWVTQNLRLFMVLRQKRYDVQLIWGQGRHSLVHGGVVFPEQMRWIWRDYQ